MFSLDTTQLYNLLGEYTEEKDEFSKKIEIINQNIPNFMNEVNKFLDINPEMKELLGDKEEETSVEHIREYDSNQESNHDTKEIEESNEESRLSVLANISTQIIVDDTDKQRDQKIKSIYRKIVKITHPDKTFDEFLHDFYLKATTYYNEKDLLSLFYICYKLRINFTVDTLEIEELHHKISDFKNKNKFLENNLTLVWFHSNEKERVILEYILSQITSKRMRGFFS